MPENKTRQTAASAAAFIAALPDPHRRADAEALSKLMAKASGEKPKMWGPSIVGLGSYHYVYNSGREGDMPLVGFAPRKAAMVIYNVADASNAGTLLAALGKHFMGKGCLYIKRLAEVDMPTLGKLVGQAVAAKRRKYQKWKR